MKSKYIFIITLFSFLLFQFHGCKPETDVPTVKTVEVTEVTQNSASGGGEVVNNGGAVVLQRGVCWSTHATPTINDNKLENKSSDNPFISKLADLKSGTTYYIRAYAVNEQGVGYGNSIEFSTLNINAPTVSGSLPTRITAGEIEQFLGEIINDGGTEIKECGFVWDLAPMPTIDKNKINAVATLANKKFNAKIMELMPDSTYYFKTYAINRGGVAYSINQFEIRIPHVADVLINNIESITDSSAVVKAQVENINGFPVIERGIYYSLISDSVLYGEKTVKGDSLGIFDVEIRNLQANKKYFVKPYAKNKYGMTVGDVKEFSTKK